MTTAPLTVLPLQKGDRIEAWRNLFEAGTQHIRTTVDGEEKVIHLSPAYVNCDVADREAVRDIVKKVGTLAEALTNFYSVLDPPMDTFIAMQEVSRMQWQPGQEIGEYFLTLKGRSLMLIWD